MKYETYELKEVKVSIKPSEAYNDPYYPVTMSSAHRAVSGAGYSVVAFRPVNDGETFLTKSGDIRCSIFVDGFSEYDGGPRFILKPIMTVGSAWE